MDGEFYGLKNNSLKEYLEEGEEELKPVPSMPAIPQPQTPKEPMEFLSTGADPKPIKEVVVSNHLAYPEVSKALAQKQKQFLTDKNSNPPPVTISPPQLSGKLISSKRPGGSIGKWFHHKEFSSSNMKKKDKARMDNAHMHSAVSVAGLAAALAAVAAAGSSNNGSVSKMGVALASATELLASHCIEVAESAGADQDRVSSVVRSAVDIQSPGDLLTLTAAAATALRGEAALKSRIPKEARKIASISPYDRGVAETQWGTDLIGHLVEEQKPPCVGELLQYTRKGVLRSKRVSIYINKKSQVIIKIKSKHVGGAFSKKHKGIVYGVCDENAAWPYRKERDSSEEVYFGVKTAQGLLEFKCKNKVHKQRWVDAIQNLIRQVSCTESTEQSLDFLSINSSI